MITIFIDSGFNCMSSSYLVLNSHPVLIFRDSERKQTAIRTPHTFWPDLAVSLQSPTNNKDCSYNQPSFYSADSGVRDAV